MNSPGGSGDFVSLESEWGRDRAPSYENVWLASRYEHAREVLRDHETFSMRPIEGFPTVSAARKGTVAEEKTTFLRMDPPEQTHYRRMLTSDFTVKRVTARRPRIEAVVDELLDKMEEAGPPIDFRENFALALPVRIVVGDLLGVPDEDHDFIARIVDTKQFQSESIDEARKAQLELVEYLEALIGERTRTAGDDPEDIISKLAVNYVRPGLLSLNDAAHMAELLAIGGFDTTANMLALGTLTLLRHPDQMALLRSDPTLITSAVLELLRFLTIGQNSTGRVCVKDTVLGGQEIKAGEGIFALITSANRDETVFADPDRLDITRNPVEHLAFGFGAHQCLGLNLAKAELEIAFTKLLARFPRLALAVPFEDIEYKHDSLFFGVEGSMPVTW